MGILGDQAMRLLRESWASPNELAEELFAMFTSDRPVTIDSPLIINNTSADGPPITINQGGSNDQTIVINRDSPDPPDVPDFPDFDFPTPGNTYITVIYADGTVDNPADDPPPNQPPDDDEQPEGGGGFPGQVISGSDNDYTVEVYESGLTLAPVSRQVRQLSIASGEVIDPGTWGLIGRVGAEYFMQLPVWGDDAP